MPVSGKWLWMLNGISIDAEKAFEKIQHQFIIKKKKTLSKLIIERKFLTLKERIYHKHTA